MISGPSLHARINQKEDQLLRTEYLPKKIQLTVKKLFQTNPPWTAGLMNLLMKEQEGPNPLSINQQLKSSPKVSRLLIEARLNLLLPIFRRKRPKMYSEMIVMNLRSQVRRKMHHTSNLLKKFSPVKLCQLNHRKMILWIWLNLWKGSIWPKNNSMQSSLDTGESNKWWGRLHKVKNWQLSGKNINKWRPFFKRNPSKTN